VGTLYRLKFKGVTNPWLHWSTFQNEINLQPTVGNPQSAHRYTALRRYGLHKIPCLHI